jgi:hypothetical protein
MIKNSDLFYNRAKEYQSKRKEVMDTYESTLAKLEKAKGSHLYTEETEKAAKTRDAALQSLQREYNEYFRISLDAMADANNKRGIAALTADQLSILQALKMRDNVSQKELDRAANSCKDNALAISVINEIAKKNGFMRGYHTENGEMSVEDADKVINNLKAALPDFMAHDTSKAARIVAEHNARLYGTTGNERPLAKRPLFEDKASCFNQLLPFGMSEATYNGFCTAVDGNE